MSTGIKRARRAMKEAAEAVRAEFPWSKPPLWRRIASKLGWKRPMSRHLAREEAKRELAYHIAIKRSARKLAKENSNVR